METGNGDRGELLRPGGVLSVLVGACLVVLGASLTLVVIHKLGYWQPNLPYLATLAGLLPVGAGHTLSIAAIVMLVLGIAAFIGGVLIVNGSRSAGGFAFTGGIVGIFVGTCLAVAGALLTVANVFELGLWQPDLPYVARLGAVLPVAPGNPLLIAAIVVLALSVVMVFGGISAVTRAGLAMEEEEQGFFYVGSERPAGGTATAAGSRIAAPPDLRTSQAGSEPGTGARAATPSATPVSTAGSRPATAPVVRAPSTRVEVGATEVPGTDITAATASPEAAVAEPGTRKSRVELESIDATRLARAKAGFSTRRVPKDDMRTLVTGDVRPRAGDVVLARIERVRQHKNLELVTGRKAHLEPGDEVIIACGNRYAADQFEGFVPERLGPAHLIAAGGVAAVEAKRARRMRPPTSITLLGLVGDASGLPLNLASYALPAPEVQGTRPPVIAVFGTSMNSGKTTAVSFLCRGLTAAGFKVGYAKLTGTGAGHDYWRVLDSGARAVVDFTDVGLVSTYRTPISVLELTSVNLIGHLVLQGCDRIVVEIADGLLQDETAALIRSNAFHALIDRVIFTAGDAMSAVGGVRVLTEHGFDVAGVSGLLTASPLPFREATGEVGVPVLRNGDLANPETAARLVDHEAIALGTTKWSGSRLDEGDEDQSAQPDAWSDSLEDQE